MAVRASRKGVPMHLAMVGADSSEDVVASHALAVGNGHEAKVESQALAADHGGQAVAMADGSDAPACRALARLEAVKEEHHAVWQQVQTDRVGATLIGQMRADSGLVEQNCNIMEAVAATGEDGDFDDDMRDARAGGNKDDDDHKGMPTTFYEDYNPNSDEYMPDHEDDVYESSIEYDD